MKTLLLLIAGLTQSVDPLTLQGLMGADPKMQAFVQSTEAAMGGIGKECRHDDVPVKTLGKSDRGGTRYSVAVECPGQIYEFTYEVLRPRVGPHKGKTLFLLQSIHMNEAQAD